MPQCHEAKKDYVQLYGRGSLHSDLTDVTFKALQRVAKVNEGEASRYKIFYGYLKRHQDLEQERQARVIKQYQREVEKFQAYQKVLEEFKVNKFITLRKDYNPCRAKTPNTYKRCRVESRICFAGFSMHALKDSVQEMSERRRPHNRRGEMIQGLLAVARKRSDFLIDRRLTNQAINENKFAAMLEENRCVSKKPYS